MSVMSLPFLGVLRWYPIRAGIMLVGCWLR